MTTYKIVSHWDGRMSSLDGETYETREEAEIALRNVGPEGLTLCRVDAGAENAWLVYASQLDCINDADGAANNAIARIETTS